MVRAPPVRLGGALGRVEDAISPGVNSAIASAKLKKELELLDAQKENVEAGTRKIDLESDTMRPEALRGIELWRRLSTYDPGTMFGIVGGPGTGRRQPGLKYENELDLIFEAWLQDIPSGLSERQERTELTRRQQELTRVQRDIQQLLKEGIENEADIAEMVSEWPEELRFLGKVLWSFIRSSRRF